MQRTTSHYLLFFHENFVIAEAIEGAVVNHEVVTENFSLIYDYFQDKEFALISHRKNNYILDPAVYRHRLVRKLRAIAIVSPHSQEKERAMAEQQQFNQSFAFFYDLDMAKNWAKSITLPSTNDWPDKMW